MIFKKFINQNIIFFTLIYIFSLSLFFLSTSFEILAVHHGPFYYFIAESLLNQNGLVPAVKLFPTKLDLVTPQIGIVFFIYISKLISANFWYLFFYFFHAVCWLFVFLEIKNFSQKNDHLNLNSFLLIVLFYLQPYNLNQVASFSNETIYYPILIYFFFKVFPKINYLMSFKNKKTHILFIILFVLLGTIFRLHHLVLISSIILYFLIFVREKNYFEIFAIITFKIIFLTLFYYFYQFDGAIFFIKKIFNYFIVENNYIEFYSNTNSNEVVFNDSINFSSYFSIERLNILLSTFSSPVPVVKFFESQYIQLFVNFSFLIIIIIAFLKVNLSSQFKKIIIIFYSLSLIFIFLLPMNEGSYYLPISFINIFILYCFFKKIFKSYFELITLSSLSTSILIFSLIYFGNSKIINLETHNFKKLNKDMNDLKYNSQKHNISAFLPLKNLNNPELWVWKLKTKICNKNIIYCINSELDEVNILYLHQKTSEEYITEDQHNYLERINFNDKKNSKLLTKVLLDHFIEENIPKNFNKVRILSQNSTKDFSYKILMLKK